jgi:lysozyme family protein
VEPFEIALEFTLKWEGGYTNHPSDPGNWTGGRMGAGTLKGTNYGISAASFPSLDIKNLTLEEVAKIYREKYWVPVAEAGVPFPASMAVFDFAVNSGVSRALRIWRESGQDLATYQSARLEFLTGLRDFNSFGRGWVRRVNDLNKELEKHTPELDIELVQLYVLDEVFDFFPQKATVGYSKSGRAKIMARLL